MFRRRADRPDRSRGGAGIHQARTVPESEVEHRVDGPASSTNRGSHGNNPARRGRAKPPREPGHRTKRLSSGIRTDPLTTRKPTLLINGTALTGLSTLLSTVPVPNRQKGAVGKGWVTPSDTLGRSVHVDRVIKTKCAAGDRVGNSVRHGRARPPRQLAHGADRQETALGRRGRPRPPPFWKGSGGGRDGPKT